MKIKNYILLLLIGIAAFSCVEDDAIVVDDHFMDYDIEIVPVETDYVVGAHYANLEIKDAVTETPRVPVKEPGKGDPEAYAQHVQQAQTAGIDYFLFTLRSTYNMTQYRADSTFIDTLLMASNASEMQFALSYNFSSMNLNDNNRIEDAGLVPAFLEDFELMMPYFQMSNYMKVDGKAVVYLPNSHNLHANDNAALYQQLRTQMSSLGVELYLIGYQNEWTPTLRYDFRFQDGVDAVTHATYANINISWWDRYNQFHKLIDQAWTYHQETFAEIGIEYIPTISPSFNPKINTPGSNNIIIEKDEAWFSGNCNIARKVAGDNKLVLVDSFNDWNRDTQVEASESYGENYLNILRQEFKTN